MASTSYDLTLSGADSPVRALAGRPAPAPAAGEALKRAADVAGAIVLLAAFLPFLVVAAIVVEATSPGSALYVQWRVGRRGRLFRMYKLRTMVKDAEKASGPVWARSADPRVTRIGRLLRDTHLDELPQLWNVLRGDMSLVGPRPERPLFVQDFSRSMPRYAARLEVRPGITGLAQICRGADHTRKDVRRKLAYDLLYIRRMNLRLDLWILFRTLGKTIPVRVGKG